MYGLAMALQQAKKDRKEQWPSWDVCFATVVLGAGELFDFHPASRHAKPVSQESPRGPGYPVYSTGVLEHALDLGLDVWIMSTHTKLQPWDDWWADCLPEGHVILFPTCSDEDAKDLGFWDQLKVPWIRLCLEIGLGFAFTEGKDSLPNTTKGLRRLQYDLLWKAFEDADEVKMWMSAQCRILFSKDILATAPR